MSVKDEGAQAVADRIVGWLQSGRSFKEISGRHAKAKAKAGKYKKKS
jgi:hypothetical protein